MPPRVYVSELKDEWKRHGVNVLGARAHWDVIKINRGSTSAHWDYIYIWEAPHSLAAGELKIPTLGLIVFDSVTLINAIKTCLSLNWPISGIRVTFTKISLRHRSSSSDVTASLIYNFALIEIVIPSVNKKMRCTKINLSVDAYRDIRTCFGGFWKIHLKMFSSIDKNLQFVRFMLCIQMI